MAHKKTPHAQHTIAKTVYDAAGQPGASPNNRDSQRRIPATVVRDLCGDISDMTLWRWLNDPTLNFPKPIYIARRRYWKEADVLLWLEDQAEAA